MIIKGKIAINLSLEEFNSFMTCRYDDVPSYKAYDIDTIRKNNYYSLQFYILTKVYFSINQNEIAKIKILSKKLSGILFIRNIDHNHIVEALFNGYYILIDYCISSEDTTGMTEIWDYFRVFEQYKELFK